MMLRMLVCLPFLLIFLAVGSTAQQPPYSDWIRIKGAESIRCKILGATDDKVEIETVTGRNQTIERKDIEWMQREFPPPELPVMRRYGKGTGDYSRRPSR